MYRFRQLTVVVLCLAGFDAIRLSEVSEKADDQSVATRETDNSQALVPHDYWSLEKAGDRCKAARRGRNVRRFFGFVVGAVIAIPVGILATFGTQTLYLAWYLTGAKDTLLFVSTYAAGLVGAWSTLMAGRSGVSLVSWTSDMVAWLFGQDGNKPVCCCAPGAAPDGERMCTTVGSSRGRRAECPPDFTHEADQCSSVETALTYNADVTDGGCKCVDVADCSKNKYARGHAWCKVQTSSGCKAYGFKLNPLKHWDYCRPAPVTTDVGDQSMTFNTYVSNFTINREKGFFRADPRFVWRFGSWVDTSKALVIAKVEGSKQSVCLPGLPEETLDGCAQMCLEVGAPIANENGEEFQTHVTCTAFAYNSHHRLCVRIPESAIGAEFKPFAKNPELKDADGWSNFRRIG